MKLNNVRKIFILGDLHLGIRNNSLEWSEIQSDFLINSFLQKVDEEGFDPDRDILVQVGDWHHVRESMNVRIYKLSLKIAEVLTKKFKRGVFMILGNHDVYYKDRTDTHSLEGFNLIYDNFHIFSKPQALTINSHNFLMLPWIESLSQLKEVVSTYRSSKYVFCHADFKGFSFNKFQKLEHGLDQEDTHAFTRIYSGHIHIRQEKGNVLYVGTPYEMDRGDRGNQKGFYVLDVSTNTISEKFIPNDFSPRHIKFDLIDLLEMTSEEISSRFKNNFVDIAIDSNLMQRFPISQFTELIKDLGHRRIEFSEYSKDQLKTGSEAELDSNYEYNIFTLLEERVAQMNLSTLHSTQLTTKFKEIYDSVRNTKQYNNETI
jgi:DNA repair exonuclease SbcCD nuclease subunit